MITKNNFIAVCIILLICFGISDMSFAQRHDDNNNTESRHGHKNKDKHEEEDDDDKDKINKKPFWSLNGNDNVNAATQFIGTVNLQSLNFRTNNLLRMALTGEGNLGLGVANPLELLHVGGNIKTDGQFLNTIFKTTDSSINVQGDVIATGGFKSGNSIFVRGAITPWDFDRILASTGSLAFLKEYISPMTPCTNPPCFPEPDDLKIGIGTLYPSSQLHLYGENPTIRLQDDFINTGETKVNFYLSAANGVGRLISDRSVTIFIDSDNTDTTEFFRIVKDQGAFDGENTLFVVNEDGKVIIGNQSISGGTHADYKLAVDGKIVGRKIVATELNWADDEFDNKLTLEDLEEEEKYVEKNKHLKGIPAGVKVEEEGIDLAEMSSLQIRKIEQIYLYLFAMNKEVKELRKENKKLKKKIKAMENKIHN